LKDIVLITINAKWIHPSLALRLLKANLGALEDSCEIIEFALRQPLAEKLEPFLSSRPKILGVSVSVWNHLATIELLNELKNVWTVKPVIVLGGPEVSHLPEDAEIFQFADHVIHGEGEIAFRELCEKIFQEDFSPSRCRGNSMSGGRQDEEGEIKNAYYLYTDEDVSRKLIYVESSRGCPFKCEFCLSSVTENKVREFPLDKFLSEMDILIQRGVKTFKFLDRSFNTNIKRALKIIEFFLNKIEQLPPLNPRKSEKSAQIRIPSPPFTVHFEMVPSLFPAELIDALSRFPPETLRLEIGIQTLNSEVAARIGRPSNPEKELEALRLLREKTSAIIHADLIAGLPGEDLESFGRGFDKLWQTCAKGKNRLEIQLGTLKLLPGTPLARHNEEFKMRYNPLPPYDIEENSTISANDMRRIKNYARFWEVLINRGLVNITKNGDIFKNFLIFSDELFTHFGRNYGIDKIELLKMAIKPELWTI